MLLTSFNYDTDEKGFSELAADIMPITGHVEISIAPTTYKVKFYRPRNAEGVVLVDHYTFKDFAEFEIFMQTQFSKYLKTHF